MDNFFPEIEISGEQAEVMARGLYAVARAEGGIHEREKTLLMSFYSDVVTDDTSSRSLAALEHAPDISPDEIAAALTSESHGLIFIKTCLLMAYADNKYGDKEGEIIEAFAKALGLTSENVDELEQDVKSYLLSSLVRLANVDAVVAVSRELHADDTKGD